MKTIFKIGMKVYDQVVFPDREGRVVNIVEKDAFPIKVYLEGIGVTHSYTKDGRVIEKISPTLSTSSYNMVGFEQKAPVPTFEDVWDEVERIYEPKSEYDKDEYKGYPSQKLADAAEALRRLLFLRDYYNEGWQPNWGTDAWKYSILLKSVHPIIDFKVCSSAGIPHVLSFKSRSVAEKFLEEQKELLIIARHLL